jgi:hypothetical protein
MKVYKLTANECGLSFLITSATDLTEKEIKEIVDTCLDGATDITFAIKEVVTPEIFWLEVGQS